MANRRDGGRIAWALREAPGGKLELAGLNEEGELIGVALVRLGTPLDEPPPPIDEIARRAHDGGGQA